VNKLNVAFHSHLWSYRHAVFSAYICMWPKIGKIFGCKWWTFIVSVGLKKIMLFTLNIIEYAISNIGMPHMLNSCQDNFIYFFDWQKNCFIAILCFELRLCLIEWFQFQHLCKDVHMPSDAFFMEHNIIIICPTLCRFSYPKTLYRMLF
jgi:hypothetical protein